MFRPATTSVMSPWFLFKVGGAEEPLGEEGGGRGREEEEELVCL